MGKIGLIGAGLVASAAALAITTRGAAREIVVVNRNHERARGLVTDLQYGSVLSPPVELRAGEYSDLSGASVVVITAGINEKAGGATNRQDRSGRLRLLDANAAIYREIVPRVVDAAPEAVILVVSDPPDALADVTRRLAGHERIVSSGTFLDSLRFRFHLGQRLGASPQSIEAQVLGEHGTSQVYLWSSARIAGKPVLDEIDERGWSRSEFRKNIEQDVRYANISIIEGTGASQLGIGIVTARLVEAILRDEQLVIPVGSFQQKYGATLSLPARLGAAGVSETFLPSMSDEERKALKESAAILREALAHVEI
jgi:L-lactate dehydrogenase